MTQTAKVTKAGETAVVEISRKSACEMCHGGESSACAACGIFTSSKSAVSRAQNPVGAKAGDIVEVESKESTILGFAALVFLLPIALPLIAFLLLSANMTTAIITAVSVFLVTTVTVYFISKVYERKKPVLVITKILKSGGEE